METTSKFKHVDGVYSLLLQAQILDSQDFLSDGAGSMSSQDAVDRVPVNPNVIPQDPVASISHKPNVIPQDPVASISHKPNVIPQDPVASISHKPNVIVVKKYEHVMMELREGIICPKCQDICQPPFMSCPDGHIFCNECIEGLNKCEKCEHTNLTNRQLVLEKVAMATNWNCDFQENGCKAVFKLNMMKEHLAQCRYKKNSSCVVNGCKHDVPLDKHAFVKHMKDVHKCKIVNVGMSNNVSSKCFKTSFKMNDYLKQKIDCKKEMQTFYVVEIKDNFFCLVVSETMDTMSFQSYAIGDSKEKESGFFCYRLFAYGEQKCLHHSIDRVISITETVGTKRKERDCANLFVIDKKKAHFLHKKSSDSQHVLECIVKISSHPSVPIDGIETIPN